jgi:hypothetical protein
MVFKVKLLIKSLSEQNGTNLVEAGSFLQWLQVLLKPFFTLCQ